jgi:hypothetical protein
MTMSLSGIAVSLLVFTTAIVSAIRAHAAQPQSHPSTAADPPAIEASTMHSIEAHASSGPNNRFQPFGSASQSMRQMRERLEDPQQRAAVRAEQRAQILESHRDLGQALGIDAATEGALIELLTDHQMDRLDEFHRRLDGSASPAQAHPWEAALRAQAENETQQVETLRELLGPERLERYQAFRRTVGERMQVGKLDARLDSAHKLSIDQKERLIALYQERTARTLERRRLASYSVAPFGAVFPGPLSAEELQRSSQLQTIAANEDIWRRMPESDRLLRQGAAEFLTAPQLTTLAQMNAEEATHLRQWIEKTRVQAGLSPDIPDQPEASQPLRAPLAGEVRLSMKLTVNRNGPSSFTHVGGNGEAVTFASVEGLVVEATPTLYDDDTFNLQMAYYEEGSTGRRRIGQMGQMGTLTRAPAGSSSLDHQGSSGTVLTGSKGYAIEVSAQVEPM